MSLRTLHLYPPAKINLGLHVLGRRPDGYHVVKTILQKLALRDRVTLTLRRGSIRVRCSDPEVPDGAGNLAFQAAERLIKATGVKASCSIYIEKRIPAAAGLGGGSGNAAAVLFGLSKLLRLDIAKEGLLGLASELGTDVPFFLGGSCALGEDRGDHLSEIRPGPVQNVLLVKPSIAISSAWAYQGWKSGLTRSFPNHKIQGVVPRFRWLPPGWEVARNDLEDVVCRSHPIVRELKEKLLEIGADFALMSGSGPTVFGFFRHAYQARQAVQIMRKDRMFAILTRTLGAGERMF